MMPGTTRHFLLNRIYGFKRSPTVNIGGDKREGLGKTPIVVCLSPFSKV